MLKETAGLAVVSNGVEAQQVIRGKLGSDVGCQKS
jgi:hypothetical protein